MKTEEEVERELELVLTQQISLKHSECNSFNANCLERCVGWKEALEWVLEE